MALESHKQWKVANNSKNIFRRKWIEQSKRLPINRSDLTTHMPLKRRSNHKAKIDIHILRISWSYTWTHHRQHYLITSANSGTFLLKNVNVCIRLYDVWHVAYAASDVITTLQFPSLACHVWQEKPINCGTKASDMLANFLTCKL